MTSGLGGSDPSRRLSIVTPAPGVVFPVLDPDGYPEFLPEHLKVHGVEIATGIREISLDMDIINSQAGREEFSGQLSMILQELASRVDEVQKNSGRYSGIVEGRPEALSALWQSLADHSRNMSVCMQNIHKHHQTKGKGQVDYLANAKKFWELAGCGQEEGFDAERFWNGVRGNVKLSFYQYSRPIDYLDGLARYYDDLVRGVEPSSVPEKAAWWKEVAQKEQTSDWLIQRRFGTVLDQLCATRDAFREAHTLASDGDTGSALDLLQQLQNQNTAWLDGIRGEEVVTRNLQSYLIMGERNTNPATVEANPELVARALFAAGTSIQYYVGVGDSRFVNRILDGVTPVAAASAEVLGGPSERSRIGTNIAAIRGGEMDLAVLFQLAERLRNRPPAPASEILTRYARASPPRTRSAFTQPGAGRRDPQNPGPSSPLR